MLLDAVVLLAVSCKGRFLMLVNKSGAGFLRSGSVGRDDPVAPDNRFSVDFCNAVFS